MADLHFLLKLAHILGAAVLFGTGLGIAFFFWMGGRSGDDRAALFAAKARCREPISPKSHKLLMTVSTNDANVGRSAILRGNARDQL